MSKQRYFVELSYLGTRYRGFQRQKNSPNIQGRIEQALSRVLKDEITIVCCGRTDAGVHATSFYVHFETARSIDDHCVYKLNKHLPDDISIDNILTVDHDKHARFHAVSRTYHYYFHLNKKSSIQAQSTWLAEGLNDLTVLHKGVQRLKEVEDFKGFCKTPDRYPHTRCTLQKIALYHNRLHDQYCFEITANRFVRGMIRNIMAELILLGRHKTTWDAFEQRCEAQSSVQLQIPAPPQGLHLAQVKYPFIEAADASKKLLDANDQWIYWE